MKRISFSMTERQFLDGTKDVTRRLGWKKLKAGDRLMAVRKAMGLKKGEKQVLLGEIEVVSVWRERLSHITLADVGREGYPTKTVGWFVQHFQAAMRCDRRDYVTRIEFQYMPTDTP